MFPNKFKYKADHLILDREDFQNDLEDFSFTFLELPKFNKDIDHLANRIEKWAYFLKHAQDTSAKDQEKLIAKDEIIEKAYQLLARLSWNATELLTGRKI